MVKVLVDARRVSLFLLYVEVDVRRPASSELRDDHRRPDRAPRLAIPQNEHVFTTVLRHLRGEAPLIVREQPLDVRSVVGQIHRVELAREGKQRLLVALDGAPYFVAAHRDPRA